MSLLHTWDGSTDLAVREWPQTGLTRKPPTAFADAVSAFFRNQRGILIALLVFVIGVTALLVLMGKTYDSHLTYLVRGEGTAFPITTFDGQVSPAEMASDLATEIQVGTEVEMLLNTELHRRTLTELQPQATPAQIEKQLIAFEKNLKVLPIPKSNLISVSFTGKSREDANAKLAALNQQYLATRAAIRGSEKAFAFFDSEADRYYQQLQDDQKSLAAFESENRVTLLEDEKALATHHLSDVRVQLNEVESALAESSRKLAKMLTERQSLPSRVETQKRELPDQIGESHLTTLLVDLQNKRQELLTKYHESDRHVQELDQQIENTRKSLQAVRESRSMEVQSDLNPIRQSVDSDLEHLKIQSPGLEARRRALQTQADGYEAELQRLDQITARHDDLIRSIKQDESNYDLYSKRREEARIDKTLDRSKIANVSLVSGPAIKPEALAPKILGIASVYLIGVILIAGIGITSGLWSPRFHAPWEIEAAAGVPVLATVPLVKGKAAKTRADAASNRKSEARAGDNTLLRLSGQDGAWTNGSVGQVLNGTHSPRLLSDADGLCGVYAALIERIRRTASSRPGGLVFAVTSSARGEGVSHVIEGLFAELEQYTGKRVACVSAAAAGSVCTSVSPLVPDVENGFKHSGEEGLRSWFRRLREANDYTLVDCPSFEESRAAVTIGLECDGVLMVVSSAHSTRNQLRGSMAALSLASIPLLGIAMNKRTYPVPGLVYRAL